jgi:hypothetical protein
MSVSFHARPSDGAPKTSPRSRWNPTFLKGRPIIAVVKNKVSDFQSAMWNDCIVYVAQTLNDNQTPVWCAGECGACGGVCGMSVSACVVNLNEYNVRRSNRVYCYSSKWPSNHDMTIICWPYNEFLSIVHCKPQRGTISNDQKKMTVDGEVYRSTTDQFNAVVSQTPSRRTHQWTHQWTALARANTRGKIANVLEAKLKHSINPSKVFDM